MINLDNLDDDKFPSQRTWILSSRNYSNTTWHECSIWLWVGYSTTESFDYVFVYLFLLPLSSAVRMQLTRTLCTGVFCH